eukprot:scaffold40171_cov59-Cyclotella_meneghiniana.AAC.10
MLLRSVPGSFMYQKYALHLCSAVEGASVIVTFAIDCWTIHLLGFVLKLDLTKIELIKVTVYSDETILKCHQVSSLKWESWGEERERVGVRLLVVETWWTKKDPFAAVLEGEVAILPLRPSITAGGDTALACLISRSRQPEALNRPSRRMKNVTMVL